VKVVFLQDVSSKGKAGEIREVADGYARNYLFPKNLALPASESAIKVAAVKSKEAAKRQARLHGEMAELAKLLQDKEIHFQAKAGEKGRLHGSITTANIADELTKIAGVEIDKKKIELDEPLRQLGSHEVRIQFSKDIIATVKVIIEEENK